MNILVFIFKTEDRKYADVKRRSWYRKKKQPLKWLHEGTLLHAWYMKKKADPNNSSLQKGTNMLNYTLEVIMKLV